MFVTVVEFPSDPALHLFAADCFHSALNAGSYVAAVADPDDSWAEYLIAGVGHRATRIDKKTPGHFSALEKIALMRETFFGQYWLWPQSLTFIRGHFPLEQEISAPLPPVLSYNIFSVRPYEWGKWEDLHFSVENRNHYVGMAISRDAALSDDGPSILELPVAKNTQPMFNIQGYAYDANYAKDEPTRAALRPVLLYN